MHSIVQKALQYLQRANYSGYFEEITKVVSDDEKYNLSKLKNIFISGQAPWDFHQQLEAFARLVEENISNSNQSGSSSGDTAGRDKIDSQINIKGDYIANQTISSSQNQKSSKQKILFLAASPEDQMRTAIEEEYRSIKTQMSQGQHRDKYEFLLPELAVTVQGLVRAMSENPEIVHFSGHGKEAGIFISNQNNEAQLMPIKALKRLFKGAKNTKVVLLNSCLSADQAREISSFGMYVIGNRLVFDSKAAVSFATGLYLGLSEGKPIEEAFNDAMIILETEFAEEENEVEIWKNGEKLDL